MQNLKIDLQMTLKAATADSTYNVDPATGNPRLPKTHHPITCEGVLWYEDDNTFRCEHESVTPDDLRTAAALRHSIALLLLEIASNS